ncbi:MAG: FISUMP domain-containing protein [Salinivirgaceae bacterium]
MLILLKRVLKQVTIGLLLFVVTVPVYAQGLVAYYPFTASNAADSSGNANNGINIGATPTTDRFGNANSAFSFDGTSNYIEMNNASYLNNNSNITLVAWFKINSITSLPDASYIISKGINDNYQYNLCVFTDSFAHVTAWQSSGAGYLVPSTNKKVVDNNWHQVVGVINNNDKAEICLDGILSGTDASLLGTWLLSGTGNLLIGKLPDNIEINRGFFNGSLDDIRIYNRAISATEISQLYANYHAPDTLIAEKGNGEITLKWSSERIAEIAKYRIYLDGVKVDIVTVATANDTVKTITGLINYQNYQFYITSVDTAGNVSQPSDTVMVQPCELITDIDGNTYTTVKIGTQIWAQQNLAVTHYQNGEEIPNVTVDATWAGLTNGAYCYYSNDFTTYAPTYGALYNYYSVTDSRFLCPVGWHVPNDTEWTILSNYLNGIDSAGGKMKEVGVIHWVDPNTGASNESGFTALPGGSRNYFDGHFGDQGTFCAIWSSTQYDASNARFREMNNLSPILYRYYNHKSFGMSVRCIKDRAATSYCVSTSGNNANTGTAASPLRNIQTALNNAVAGDTIKVASGAYNEVLTTQTGVKLFGGYNETFSEVERDIFNNKTIVEGVSTKMLTDQYASTIDGFIFHGNSSVTDEQITLNNGSIFSHNIVIGLYNAYPIGIRVNGGATVINNTLYICYWGIDIQSGTGTPNIRNNIIENGSYGMNTYAFSSAVRTYNNVHPLNQVYSGTDQNPGTGDITQIPKFRDPANNDFRLLESSPCVDAGDPADNVLDEPSYYNTRIDMGAYGGTIHSPYLPPVPDAPTLALPVNGATHQPQTITLQWYSLSETDMYYLQVSTDPMFLTGIIYEDAYLADTFVSISSLNINTTYYWRVLGSVTLGDSPYSTSNYFTTTTGNLHVTTSGNDANDGSTSSPLRNIQTALNRAVSGDTIKVAAGTYSQVLTTGVSVRLLGGFSASFLMAERDFFNNKTIVEGISTKQLTDQYASTIDGFIFHGTSSVTDEQVSLYNGSIFTHNIVIGYFSAYSTGIKTYGGSSVINNSLNNCYYGLDIWDGTGTPNIRNNIIKGGNYGMNTYYFTAAVRTYNNVFASIMDYSSTDQNPGTGDISLEPLFRDAANYDFRILENSPSVDAGDPNDSPGAETYQTSRIDMGAYGGTKHSPYLPPLPDAPTLALPANNATHQPLSITFKWYSLPEVNTYHIQLSTDPTFATAMIHENSTLTDTLVDIPNLTNNTTYYWRVRASVTIGDGLFSSSYTFTTTPGVIHVATTGNDANSGTSDSPLRYIQTALNKSVSGDTVKVAAGSYSQYLNTLTNVILRGGYDGTFTENNRNIFQNKTTLNGVSTVVLNDTKGSSIDGFVFNGGSSTSDAVVKLYNGSVLTRNVFQNLTATMANNIELYGGAKVINNTVYGGSVAIDINSGTGTPVIKNNIFCNTSFGVSTNSYDASVRSYNCVYGNTYSYTGFDTNPGNGDISVNPLFKNATNRDFRLLPGSPAIDAGDPSAVYNDTDGSTNDMGAFAYEQLPDAPTNLKATAADKQVSLQWNQNTESNFLRYRIYGGTSANPTSKMDSTTNGATDTSKTITGLTNGVTYYFRITAVNNVGLESDYSNEVSVRVVNDPSLLAYYPFNNVSLNDESGYGNHASTGNFISHASDRFGIINSAFVFNGTDDYLYNVHNYDLLTTATFSGWFNLYANAAASDWHTFFLDYGNTSGYGMMYSVTNKLIRIYNQGAIRDVSFDFPYDTWMHVGVTFDGTNLRCYINGALIDTHSYTDEILDQGKLYIGCNSNDGVNSGGYFWNGIIDDIRIYSCALSESEMLAQYCVGGWPAPNTPSGLTTKAGNGQALLLWNQNQEPDFLKYRIYMGTDSVTMILKDSSSVSIADTSKLMQGLTNNIPYYFRVTAMDTNRLESVKSYAVKVIPNEFPAAPKNLTAQSGNGQVTLKWNQNTEPDFLKYRIYVGSDSVTMELKDSTSVSLADTSIVISGLTNNLRYYFRITSMDNLRSESEPSNAVEAIPNAAPEAPANLLAVSGNHQITLTWSQNSESDFLKYMIYMGSDSVTMILNDSTSASNTDVTKTITGLTNNAVYYFRVSAIDTLNLESGTSNTAKAIPNAAPAAPINLTASVSLCGVSLKWQQNTESDFLKYLIYMGTEATVLELIDSSKTSITDTMKIVTGLNSNSLYYFRVTAMDTLRLESEPSNTVEGTISSYFTDMNADVTGVKNGAIAAADYDNDGNMDFAITGFDGTSSIAKIYQNKGEMIFEPTAISLPGIQSSNASWGDYNNDSYLDILITGNNGTSDLAAIYKNNGNNTFSIQNQILLTEVSGGSTQWGDYDNDGDLDILLSGFMSSGQISKIYKNNGNNTFSEKTDFVFEGMHSGQATWIDFDNDNDLDVFLIGHYESGYKTNLYLNDGTGDFTLHPNSSINGIDPRSLAWGDYDNDNDLDIILVGTDGVTNKTKIFKNEGNNLFSEASNLELPWVAEGSVRWLDFNNDGLLDILFSGWDSNSIIAKIYKNNGNSTFTEQSDISLVGVQNGSMDVADFDNDGDIDLLITGEDGVKPFSKIYRNNSTVFNFPPSTPANMTNSVDFDKATLAWNIATDTVAGSLSYNIKVGSTSDGFDIVSPAALNTGKLTKPALGNAQLGTSFLLNNLEPGTYYWSVQAIDNGWLGSEWSAEQQFVVTNSALQITVTDFNKVGISDVNYIINPNQILTGKTPTSGIIGPFRLPPGTYGVNLNKPGYFNFSKNNLKITDKLISLLVVLPTLADYNGDTQIDITDLDSVIINWRAENPLLEMGPAIGNAPEFTVIPDNAFNFEDLMIFGMLWDFYNTNKSGNPTLIASHNESLQDWYMECIPTVNRKTNTVTLKYILKGNGNFFSNKLVLQYNSKLLRFVKQDVLLNALHPAMSLVTDYTEPGFFEISIGMLDEPIIKQEVELVSVTFDLIGQDFVVPVASYEIHIQNEPNRYGIAKMLEVSGGISIFPNPTTTFITISKPSDNSEARVSLRDLTGKIVKMEHFNEQQTTIDISGLPQGILFIEVTSGSKTKYFKIVKQ